MHYLFFLGNRNVWWAFQFTPHLPSHYSAPCELLHFMVKLRSSWASNVLRIDGAPSQSPILCPEYCPPGMLELAHCKRKQSLRYAHSSHTRIVPYIHREQTWLTLLLVPSYKGIQKINKTQDDQIGMDTTKSIQVPGKDWFTDQNRRSHFVS